MSDTLSGPQPTRQAVEPAGGAQQGCPVAGCKICGGDLTFGYGAETRCVGCEAMAFLAALGWGVPAWQQRIVAEVYSADWRRLFIAPWPRHGLSPALSTGARFTPADPRTLARGGQRE